MKDYNKLRFFVLNIVKNNASIKIMIYEGFNYRDVATEYANILEENLVIEEKQGFVLTAEGECQYEKLSKFYAKKNKKQWIEKDLKNKIEQIDKKTIFLPLQNELTFILED